MKISDIITESTNTPIIVVDVQPAYCGEIDGPHRLDMVDELAIFLSKHKGQVLMMVNAEQEGLTSDTIWGTKGWWKEIFMENRVSSRCMGTWEWLDKGFGYLRGWMDQGVDEATIIKAIREMYSQKVTDSRMLFNEDLDQIEQFFGSSWQNFMYDDAISVEWVSISKLREFNGGYICGGGRDQCLLEVQLLLRAFNIRLKVIEKFVYD